VIPRHAHIDTVPLCARHQEAHGHDKPPIKPTTNRPVSNAAIRLTQTMPIPRTAFASKQLT
jgi:hypothetical protein